MNFKEYDNENIFAKILKNEIPCSEVYQDDHILAFEDINPAAKIHVLVIPKEKFISFDDFIANANDDLKIHFFNIVKKIANDLNLAESGYRLVTNHGQNSGQIVPHFHVHILGGNKLGGL